MASTKVKTRTIDFKTLVKRAEGKQYNAPELQYVFSNGRKFYDKPVRSR